MSWGFNEFPGETQYDSTFTTPGITYIAASGDYARRGLSGRLARRAGRRRDVAGPQCPGRPMAPRPPGTTAAAATASSSPSRPISSRSRPPASGARPTSPSTAIRIPARRSTSPRRPAADAGTRARPRARGRPSAARAWAPRPGPGSSRSSTRAATWPGLSNLERGHADLAVALRRLPSSDFHAIAASPTGTPWGSARLRDAAGGADSAAGARVGRGHHARHPHRGATANTQTGLGTPNGPALINDLVASTVTSPAAEPDVHAHARARHPRPTRPRARRRLPRRRAASTTITASRCTGRPRTSRTRRPRHTKQVVKQGKPAVKAIRRASSD